MRNYFVWIVALIAVSAQLWATSEKSGPNHLELAAMMYYDGNYTKATNELKAVARNAEEFDAARFYTISGLVAMKTKKYDKAAEYLQKAIEATKVKKFVDPYAQKQKARKHIFLRDFKKEQKRSGFDPEKIRKQKLEQLYLFLSRAYYRQKNYQKAIEALDAAGEAAKKRPGLFLYKADCYWKMGNHAAAIDLLNEAITKFPDTKTLWKQKFYYLAKLQLYHPAAEVAKKVLRDGNTTAKEYITFAQVLLRGGEKHEATALLEEANLKYDNEAKIPLLLGNIYLREAMLHSSAQLLEKGAMIDRKYLRDAVEMYRRAKELPHARYLNALNSDPVSKLKAKVAILVSQGAFEKLAGLREDLARYGLLENDTIRYALAYAYYSIKEYALAEAQLKKITDNQLFAKATIIRKNIEKCKQNSLECL